MILIVNVVGINMGDLSENFSKWEFACPHCGLSNPDSKLIESLQKYRDILNVPIKITSGGRCIAVEGKYPNSQHMVSQNKTSKAADCIALNGINLLDMYYTALKIPGFNLGGIGIYPNKDNPIAGFLHLDIRQNFARWARIEGTYGRHQDGLNYIFQNLQSKGVEVEMQEINQIDRLQKDHIYQVPFIGE
jgi:hypothetical protein